MSARRRVAFLAAGLVAAQGPGASSVGVAVGVSSLPRHEWRSLRDLRLGAKLAVR